eukprot:Sspe_Gene.50310::Locus_27903_Transcript_1_1_Confidence_1.000_Length_3437::g.50310::m.50310
MITVDGRDITSRVYDGETCLLRSGVERITFDIPFPRDLTRQYEKTPSTLLRAAAVYPSPPPPASQELCTQYPSLTPGRAISQPEMTPVRSAPDPEPVAKVVLLYYPFRDGKETMPIPSSVALSAGSYSDEVVPLADRQQGLEVFWNGRLLPKELIKHWPIIRNNKLDRDIPAACYRRVKGMVFVDSNFEVSSNKLSLCTETPLGRALIEYEHRLLSAEVRKWIKYCHQKYDEELIFGPIDNDRLRADGRLHYKHVKVGQNIRLCIGSLVVARPPLGTRGRVLGKVTAIFTDPEQSESSHRCLIKVQRYMGPEDADVQPAPLTLSVELVEKVLGEKEMTAERRKLRRHTPCKVEVVHHATELPSESALPPSVIAGKLEITTVTVAVCNYDSKPVPCKAPVDLCLTATPFPRVGGVGPPLVMHVHCEPPSGKGKPFYVFPISALVEEQQKTNPNLTLFRFAGEYKFDFSTPQLPNVKGKSCTVMVKGDSGSIDRVDLASTEPIETDLGDEIPDINIVVTDILGNILPLSAFATAPSIHCKITPGMLEAASSSAYSGIQAHPPASSSDPISFTVRGIEVQGDLSSEGEERRLGLTFTIAEKEYMCEVPLIVHAGKASSLRVLKQLPDKGLVWGDPLCVVLSLEDKWGNATKLDKGANCSCTVEVSGNAKLDPKPSPAPLSHCGDFSFDTLRLVRPSNQEQPDDVVSVVLTFIAKVKRSKTVFRTTLPLDIMPPSAATHLRITGPAVVRRTPTDTFITTEVGCDVSSLTATVENPASLEVAGLSLVCSWAEGITVQFK